MYTMPVWVLAMPGVYVCLSQFSILSKRMDKLFFFDVEAFIDLFYSVFWWNSGIYKNKGTVPIFPPGTLSCCLPCFDNVGWAAGRASGLKKTEQSGAGIVICLERGADLHMSSWCHCHSLSLASVKSRLVLPFWPTRVVPDKGPLNWCVCVWTLS